MFDVHGAGIVLNKIPLTHTVWCLMVRAVQSAGLEEVGLRRLQSCRCEPALSIHLPTNSLSLSHLVKMQIRRTSLNRIEKESAPFLWKEKENYSNSDILPQLGLCMTAEGINIVSFFLGMSQKIR